MITPVLKKIKRVPKQVNSHVFTIINVLVIGSFVFVLSNQATASEEDQPSLAARAEKSLEQSQETLSTFSKSKPQKEDYSTQLDQMNWINPSPSYKDLDIDIKDLETIVADRIVLMVHPRHDIEVPSFGKMIRWNNARYVTAITEFPMSAKAARQLIIDNDNKNGWSKVEPFVKKTKVLHGDPSKAVGLHYKIKANISIINVHGNFYARNTYEENSDITSLFLNADIGVSLGFIPIIPKAVLSPLEIANARRWEFIEIDDNRSFLAITDWSEVLDGTALSRRMTQYHKDSPDDGMENKLSDEELVGPYPGVAMNMYNFKKAVLNQLANTEISDTAKTEKKILKGKVPDIAATLPKKIIERLTEEGPVIFMHPVQNIHTDYGGYPLHFVTAVNSVNASFEDARRFGAQMHRYSEYVPQLDSSKLVGGTYEIPDFTSSNPDLTGPKVQLQLLLGKRVKVISAFKIDYWLDYFWENENRLGFEVVKGEIETIQGAVEWLPTEREDRSLLLYTVATDLGPKPKFPLSLSQKIPGSDISSGVIVTTMAVGRQGPWIEYQLKLEKENTAPKIKDKE